MPGQIQPPKFNPRCVTYTEAQAMLSLSRSSLYKLIALRHLHPIKIPGLRSRRILLTEIDGLLNGAIDEIKHKATRYG